jgi:hypothetical protein
MAKTWRRKSKMAYEKIFLKVTIVLSRLLLTTCKSCCLAGSQHIGNINCKQTVMGKFKTIQRFWTG